MLYSACANERPFTAASLDTPLPDDDGALRDATIGEVSQAVFSAGQLGALVGHSVPVGYKYRDLVLQVAGVSNLRQ
jgi:hypothetical protein